MKSNFKFFLPVLAVAAFIWIGCQSKLAPLTSAITANQNLSHHALSFGFDRRDQSEPPGGRHQQSPRQWRPNLLLVPGGCLELSGRYHFLPTRDDQFDPLPAGYLLFFTLYGHSNG